MNTLLVIFLIVGTAFMGVGLHEMQAWLELGIMTATPSELVSGNRCPGRAQG